MSARSAAFVFGSAAKAGGFRRDDSLWAMRQHQDQMRIVSSLIALAICRDHNFRGSRRRR